ncbi:MAG: FAD-binding protein [Symbiopectobacterium sp.]
MAPPAPVSQKWDTTVDVLIIEKMPLFGGYSILNGGDLSAAGSSMQQALGIKDSPELMYQDMMKEGN